MNFSRLRSLTLGALLVSQLSACGLFGIKEPVRKSEPLRMKESGTSCFKGASALFERYVEGNASETEIRELFDCADRSLDLFVTRTRTKNPGKYEPHELKNFLEKYFLASNVKVTQALLEETMELKRSVLGGSANTLTSQELQSARKLLQTVRDQFISLRPYMPIDLERYIQPSQGEKSGLLPGPASDADLDRLGIALEKAFSSLGRSLEETAANYSLYRFQKFLTELQASAYDSESLQKLIRRIPLIRSVKQLVLGTPSFEVKANEWVKLLSMTARATVLGMKAREYVLTQENEFACGADRERLASLASQTIEFISQSVRYHAPDAAVAETTPLMITFEELDRVVDSLDVAELAPLRASSIKGIFRTAVRRYLGGGVPGPTGTDAQGITLAALERANSAVKQWLEGQRYLELTFERLGHFSCELGSELPKPGYTSVDLLSIPLEDLYGPLESVDPVTLAAAERMREIIETQAPLFRHTGFEIYLNPIEKMTRHSYHSLSLMNWIDLGYRLAIQSYGQAKGGLALKELETLYADIIPIGTDVGFVDPNSPHAARDRFRDSNLFFSSSDGNGLLGQAEAIQLVSFLLSAKRVALRVHDVIEPLCKPGIEGGSLRPIDISCYRRQYFSQMKDLLVNLPAMAAYHGSLHAKAADEFERSLLAIAKFGRTNPTSLDTIDAERIEMVLQYIESLFVTFDKDRSGTLTTDEALTAFPRFEGTLREMTRGKLEGTPEEIRALFTYMLDRGYAPETLAQKASFLLWKFSGPSFWKIKADRSQIVKILYELSKSAPAQPAVK